MKIHIGEHPRYRILNHARHGCQRTAAMAYTTLVSDANFTGQRGYGSGNTIAGTPDRADLEWECAFSGLDIGGSRIS